MKFIKLLVMIAIPTFVAILFEDMLSSKAHVAVGNIYLYATMACALALYYKPNN